MGDPLAALVGLNDEAVVALFNLDVHGAQGGRGFQGEFQHQGLVFRGGSVQLLNRGGVPVRQFGRVHTASCGGFQLVVLHFLRGTSQQFQFMHAAFQAVPVRGNVEQAAGTLSQAGVIRGNPGFFLLFYPFCRTPLSGCPGRPRKCRSRPADGRSSPSCRDPGSGCPAPTDGCSW